jgi:hypothetical protein
VAGRVAGWRAGRAIAAAAARPPTGPDTRRGAAGAAVSVL